MSRHHILKIIIITIIIIVVIIANMYNAYSSPDFVLSVLGLATHLILRTSEIGILSLSPFQVRTETQNLKLLKITEVISVGDWDSNSVWLQNLCT